MGMLEKFSPFYLKLRSLLTSYKEKFLNVSSSDLRDCFLCGLDFIVQNKNVIIKLSVPFLLITVLAYSCASSRRALSYNIDAIFQIAEHTRGYYADKPDYWKLSTDTLLKDNVVPLQYVKDENILLKNDIYILLGEGYEAAPVSPRSVTFDIVMPNLNKAQCLSYAEAQLTKSQLLVLDKITIHNANGDFVYTWGGENRLPVEKYSSKNFCSQRNNILIWSLK